MYSICTACDQGFYGKMNELHAWQLLGVKCTEAIREMLKDYDRLFEY